MLAVKLADEAVNIGPPAPKKSYLNIEAVIAAAKAAGVDAVHPGYGFLSENGDFADAVRDAGMIFIGPPGDAIRTLGDKVAARQVAKRAGVPTVPGSDGRVAGLDNARLLAAEIGFPVMIKAAAGGGGRGIRIVGNIAELEQQFPLASAEALAAFGDGGLYMEKVISRARHVEVQIFSATDGISCISSNANARCSGGARRCGKRHPPSCCLPTCANGSAMSAVALARGRLSRRRHGRVSLRRRNGRLLFHRGQHPHPGRASRDRDDDRVRSGAGNVQGRGRCGPVGRAATTSWPAGHAIECRINAEDPFKAFQPSPGTISVAVRPGSGEGGIRFDTMLYEGYTIPPLL